MTVAPETNPAPCTVSVKLLPPGVAMEGDNGTLRKGTGFCANAAVEAKSSKSRSKARCRMSFPQFAGEMAHALR